MPKQTNLNLQGSPPNAPYERVLSKAFDKLTSEVLIFLLAYTILLVVLVWIGPNLGTWLLTLFYIIPILGLITYVWLKRRDIAQREQEREVQVKVRRARGEAYVVGEEGSFQNISGSTTVNAGNVSDKARVKGRVIGSTPSDTSNSDANYLVSVFERLNRGNQTRIVSQAIDMLTRQDNPDA
jgi:hypothetical protein